MLRIKSLQVFDHILLKDCVFNFCSEENDIGEPFFSIVIGVNGTGKSRLLKSILEIFIHLTEFKEKGKYKRFPNSFYIEYSIKEYNFQIEYKYNIISIKRNKTEISINELEIPTKFLAVTTSLYDRFPKYNSKHSLAKERYKYLGIRAASNNAFIGMQTSKTAEFIAEIISQNKNIETLKFLFSKLDIGSNIKLIFKKGRNYNKITDWFNNNKSISIRNIFQQITPEQTKKESTRINTSYRSEKYKRILAIKEDFKKVEDLIIKYIQNKRIPFYELNLDDKNTFLEFMLEIEIMELLSDFEIYKFETLGINKKEHFFELEDASSGEYSLITSIVSLIANIQENSIVVIDEPELSLHPNWQQKYIGLLTNIFKSFSSCHFIIASHSHFLPTNIKQINSSITALSFKDGSLIAELIKYDTFGWTPENILYNVFGVVTMRNYYFEMDLKMLLKLISEQSTEVGKIKTIISNLENTTILENDPLRLILDNAKDYVNGII